MDNVFCLGGKMEGLPAFGRWKKVPNGLDFSGFDEAGQAEHTHAHAGALEELAAGGDDIAGLQPGEMWAMNSGEGFMAWFCWG